MAGDSAAAVLWQPMQEETGAMPVDSPGSAFLWQVLQVRPSWLCFCG